MLSLLTFLPLFTILSLIIVFCANTDKNSSQKEVFKDKFEEVSENMDFHVVQNAVDPNSSEKKS